MVLVRGPEADKGVTKEGYLVEADLGNAVTADGVIIAAEEMGDSEAKPSYTASTF